MLKKDSGKGGGLKTTAPSKDDQGPTARPTRQETAYGYQTSLSSANDGSYNVITGRYRPELAILFSGEF